MIKKTILFAGKHCYIIWIEKRGINAISGCVKNGKITEFMAELCPNSKERDIRFHELTEMLEDES